MKKKKVLLYFLTVIMLLSMTVGVALAEDGDLFRKNISKTPDNETEKANIMMMDFYVPAQSAAGIVGPVDNYILDDDAGTVAYEARDYAKPLISVYIDDIGHTLEAKGGITFGEFDAFAGVSLDDGTTWKTTNLSKSADLSSFFLHTTGEAYPGDVHNVVHQVAEDNIFVAWVSKYCDGGTPLYTLPSSYPAYLTSLEDYGKNAMYLTDLFGVMGSQGSVDYELQGYPEIGEIPYSCVWTARGKLLAGDDPNTEAAEDTYVMWTKPERLTSGKRDANLPAVDCAGGAGCILTWQEDPEGLRPGQGLGPGEGWSGAIANAKTDIWYSYIGFDDFDLVVPDYDNLVPVSMTLFDGVEMPKSYVPMAMPVRLTDNNMCRNSTKSDPYCFVDFDAVDDDGNLILPDTLLTARNADSDFCTNFESWTTPGGSTQEICIAEDGRFLAGRVGATRVRLNLKPYTTSEVVGINDNDTPDDPSDDFEEYKKSAWVVMAYEETKAMGDGISEEEIEPADIGKDVWYHSFDMFDPDFVAQGGMLNQPAIDHETGVFFDMIDPVETWEDPLYETEIARRFALTTNSAAAIKDSTSGLSAMLIYKQGIINQGGPADIFMRRVLVEPTNYTEANFTATATSVCTGVTDMLIEETDPGDDESIPNISGVVTDINGVPVSCLSLDLISTEDEISTIHATVYTDLNGEFAFWDVSDSSYSIVVTDEKEMLLDYDQSDPDILVQILVDEEPENISLEYEKISCTGFVDAQGDDIDSLLLADISGSIVDGDEIGLQCISVDLIKDDEVIATVLTDEEGQYLFQDYGDGVITFTIEVTDEHNLLLEIPEEFEIDADVIGYDPDANPYAYENMECEYEDGSSAWVLQEVDDNATPDDDSDDIYENTNYLKGLCLSPAINISGSSIVACDNVAGDCSDSFPWDGGVSPFPKVTRWLQTEDNLDDQSWDNPYDVSKGHRGFLDGDIVMIMYAWSPNWNANAVGNDHYNLYTRRSFDGGSTWTTTPGGMGGEGVTTTENYYSTTVGEFTSVDTFYPAGEFEQARNVSLLTGNKITILDPRYTPSGGLKQYTEIKKSWLADNGFSTDGLPYVDDVARDPSKFFVVYETGDNTTVAEGEAIPLNLYYSRAELYGDEYELMDYKTDSDNDLMERWPWLENKADDLSGEASIVSNPGATFMYAVWNQWQEEIGEDGHELISESDMIFRRLLYLNDDSKVQTNPVVSFLYTGDVMYSIADDDIITMIITARDLDKLGEGEGITEYEWTFMTPDGYEQKIADCTGKVCNVPARTLSNGWDGFGSSGGVGWAEMAVRVKDNDPNQVRPEEMGNWSNQIKTSLMLATDIYKVQLPFLTR